MNLGKFQQVELREHWGKEATDFTPWLTKEENIKELGKTIGIEDIEFEDREVSIGSFKADILCRDSDNNKIIIENQLEKSNHSHLGQIITYASGVDASIIIWICSEITDEHRQAIDWLNEHTDEDINFFAIVIELWKIDDSIPAPRFNVMCRPNKWAKTTKAATTSTSRHEYTEEECEPFWREEENKPTVEMAEYLKKIFSESGAIADFRVRKESWIVFGTQDENTTYFKFNKESGEFRFRIDVSNRDKLLELKKYLEDKHYEYVPRSHKGVHISIKDMQFIDDHKEMFIEIAKFVKDLKTRA